jgi:hypothetical protein
MPVNILLSTAYLPPAEYFARIANAGKVLIEKEENYIKQTYRNRCYILSASGPQALTVPVYKGSPHKTPVKDIRIDYSKRWQQVHLGALAAAYGSSPFFLYYYESIEKIILHNHEFLLDLNMDLLRAILKMIKLEAGISYTESFSPAEKAENDFRYSISPKNNTNYRSKQYTSVFITDEDFSWRLSIVDLLFNTGPDADKFL